MPLLQQILPAAIVAMMVAAGVFGLALFWGRERARGALGPLAIGLAYLVRAFRNHGLGNFPARGYDQLAALFCPDGRRSGRVLHLGRDKSLGARAYLCLGFRWSAKTLTQAKVPIRLVARRRLVVDCLSGLCPRLTRRDSGCAWAPICDGRRNARLPFA